MTNKLNLATPFESYKVITSDFDLEVLMGEEYRLSFDFNYLNKTKFMKVCCQNKRKFYTFSNAYF